MVTVTADCALVREERNAARTHQWRQSAIVTLPARPDQKAQAVG